MNRELIVKVERMTNNPQMPFKCLFERRIEFNSDVLVDYNSLTSSLYLLFGKDTYIHFIISQL